VCVPAGCVDEGAVVGGGAEGAVEHTLRMEGTTCEQRAQRTSRNVQRMLVSDDPRRWLVLQRSHLVCLMLPECYAGALGGDLVAGCRSCSCLCEGREEMHMGRQ
jgi:hypothetical protein